MWSQRTSQEAPRDFILAAHWENNPRVQSVAITSNHDSVVDLMLSQRLWVCILLHAHKSHITLIFFFKLYFTTRRNQQGRWNSMADLCGYIWIMNWVLACLTIVSLLSKPKSLENCMHRDARLCSWVVWPHLPRAEKTQRKPKEGQWFSQCCSEFNNGTKFGMCVDEHESTVASRGQKEAWDFPGARVTANCELPHIGAGNPNWVLCKITLCP